MQLAAVGSHMLILIAVDYIHVPSLLSPSSAVLCLRPPLTVEHCFLSYFMTTHSRFCISFDVFTASSVTASLIDKTHPHDR